ncbi:MAG: hypothetical protein E5Y34_32950, partial [Mesorhizobium sp.]
MLAFLLGLCLYFPVRGIARRGGLNSERFAGHARSASARRGRMPMPSNSAPKSPVIKTSAVRSLEHERH